MRLLSLLLASIVCTTLSAGTPKICTKGDLIIINDITINKKTAEIRLQTSFAISGGILEYFLVGDEGKTYESALQLNSRTKASELNFALLLIGAQPVPFRELLAYQKQPKGFESLCAKYPNSVFEIDISIYGVTLSPLLFLKDRENKHPHLYWIYTGGYFTDTNTYMADIDYCTIGIWPDPSAPLNLFNLGSNPYENDESGFELIHPDDIEIKADFPAEIIIRKQQKEKK